MKKIILPAVLFAALLFTTNTFAQDYKSAIGLRLGYPLSVSFKTFLNESNAVEVYAGTRGYGSGFGSYRWWIVSGAYQIHKPLEIGDIEGLGYYFGAGASVFFWSFDEGFGGDYSTTTFGIQAYAGLNYSLENTPINITVDWIPTYFFSGFGSGFGAGYGTIGIRYILSR
jgi:hypothetical protein